ncbi:universal stress protein [Haloplanus natans]|uniref:universal stress protein n=1 Tax=Haloplanus natans TaxID=376171 RepID=UPI000677765B|nr:universal stress protein [Haloplanus natans]
MGTVCDRRTQRFPSWEDVRLETVVAFGKLTDAVREYCSQHPVDTVIVVSTDRDAFGSYVVGDDVTRVANTAPVPVVVV